VNFKLPSMIGGSYYQPYSIKTNHKSRQSTHKEEGHRLRPEQVLEELNSLIGLSEVKNLVLELSAFMEIQKRREKMNLRTEPLVLHMIFKGNPGTGKQLLPESWGSCSVLWVSFPRGILLKWKGLIW